MSGPIRIALLEPDADLRLSLAASLRSGTGSVLTGVHAEASSLLHQLPDDLPHVVVMSIGLMGTTGTATIRRCRELHATTQFLMHAAADDTVELFPAIAAGALGFLHPTATDVELLDAVGILHAGGSPMSAVLVRRVLFTFRTPVERAVEFHLLSERERQVLEQLALGHRYKEIAIHLHLSIDTVRTHIRNLYDKLQVSSRTDALNKVYPRSKG